jgi:hypothetical protein
MHALTRRLAYVLALAMAFAFAMSDADMSARDALRPGTPAQISHASAGPCAALAAKQLEQQQDPDTTPPPVVASSPLVCELGDAVVLSGEPRFCGHSVTNETRSDRAFNPCAPARAGPKL